jgi:hypothetical protein
MAQRRAKEAAFFAVDDLAQYRLLSDRHFDGFREPDAELAQVVSGEVAVPESGRRMFLNMWIAMDDVAFGGFLYELARGRGLRQGRSRSPDVWGLRISCGHVSSWAWASGSPGSPRVFRSFEPGCSARQWLKRGERITLKQCKHHSI